MTKYSWKLATSGHWATASAWTPTGPPNAGSADVVIGVAGSYSVTLDQNGNYSVDSLTLSDAGATLIIDGELDFTGARTLRVTAGTLELSGTIKGAILSQTGGAIVYNGGTLSGATIRGTLDVEYRSLVLTNGITLTGADGTGAGALTIGQTSVTTIGNMTLDNATVMLRDNLGLDDASVAGVLTLGRGLTLQNY